MTLEILLPLRNPTAALIPTIDSLVGQKRRDFSVLLSDNHSTSGQEILEAAVRTLSEAGLTVRRVRPPMELKRVEHWNWLHFQSRASWLKPLFMGDWLEAEYMAIVLDEAEANPRCAYIYCSFLLHRNGKKPISVPVAAAGRYFSAEEMGQRVLRYGMQFGPPSAAAYKRDVFVALGGYRTTLPICADSFLYCGLAARFGALGIARPLSNFSLHEARFSITLPGRQADSFREKLTFMAALVYHAFTERIPLPRWGVLRFFAREIRQRLQEIIGGSPS